jgi:hypothetical protein
LGLGVKKKAYMTDEVFRMGRFHCFEALAWQDTKKTPIELYPKHGTAWFYCQI